MTPQEILNVILVTLYAFITSVQLWTLIGLIFLDIMFGIARAIREKVFDWRKVGQFYQTMVLPYIIGYLALFVFVKVASAELLGSLGYVVSDVVVWGAWMMLVTTIGGSFLDNARALGYQIEQRE